MNSRLPVSAETMTSTGSGSTTSLNPMTQTDDPILRSIASRRFFSDGDDSLWLDQVNALRAQASREEPMDPDTGAEVENDAFCVITRARAAA